MRLRKPYTEGETAALVIIAREVQQHGVSDLPIGRIAPAAVQLIRVSPLLIEASVQGTPVCRGNPTRWFLPGDGASKPPPGIYTNMMTESESVKCLWLMQSWLAQLGDSIEAGQGVLRVRIGTAVRAGRGARAVRRLDAKPSHVEGGQEHQG